MKTIERSDATGTLADYAKGVGEGPLILTDQGRPVAALVSIDNADLETVSLSSNPQFIELIERSRACVQSEGGVPSEEMRRRLD
jgi:antitoxin (DNA-binding transcriptional repressor) of toxin-antitoxin stability system